MMITTAIRLFAWLLMSVYGVAGAAIYYLVMRDGSHALAHALFWCGMAWAIGPNDEDKAAYYAFLDQRLKAHQASVGVRP